EAKALRLRDQEAELRRKAVAETYRAVLSETQARRLVRYPGWQYESLQALQKLAALETPSKDMSQLRTEAATAAGELDVRELTRFQGHTTDARSLEFSPDGKLLASADQAGSVRLWDLVNGKQLREFTDGAAVPPSLLMRFTSPSPDVAFSGDGNSLLYAG